MGFAFQQHAAGRQLPGEWLIDHLATRRRPAALSPAKGALLLWAASTPDTRDLRWAC
jgi:hypothetical protein